MRPADAILLTFGIGGAIGSVGILTWSTLPMLAGAIIVYHGIFAGVVLWLARS